MDINLTGVLHGTNLAIRWKILFYPTLNILGIIKYLYSVRWICRLEEEEGG